ncbi:MAG: hypothetical protein Q7S28_02415, partial [bacterium]|nr:hypothetical protein [bacterium]
DEELSAIGDYTSFHTASALGMLARHQAFSPERTKEVREKLLVGKPDRMLAAPREWMRGLSKDAIDQIEDIAVSEVTMLYDLFGDLHEKGNDGKFEDASFRLDLLELLQRREKIEGISTLLREVGAGDGLKIVLESLDIEGDNLVGSIPLKIEFDDELLRRSRVSGNWWTKM